MASTLSEIITGESNLSLTDLDKYLDEFESIIDQLEKPSQLALTQTDIQILTELKQDINQKINFPNLGFDKKQKLSKNGMLSSRTHQRVGLAKHSSQRMLGRNSPGFLNQPV